MNEIKSSSGMRIRTEEALHFIDTFNSVDGPSESNPLYNLTFSNSYC